MATVVRLETLCGCSRLASVDKAREEVIVELRREADPDLLAQMRAWVDEAQPVAFSRRFRRHHSEWGIPVYREVVTSK